MGNFHYTVMYNTFVCWTLSFNKVQALTKFNLANNDSLHVRVVRPFTINLLPCISSSTKWAGGRSTLDFKFWVYFAEIPRERES